MIQFIAAYLIDIIIGDPKWLTHPVVIIGKGIDWLETFLRRRLVPLIGLKAAGMILTALIVGTAYLITWLIVAAAYKLNYWFGLITAIWLLSTTLSVKGLKEAALDIFALLDQGEISEARRKTGWIVGRDTADLDESEITRATVETVAENTVDGIIAPMFFAFIGGAPLAMAYKAVNTLDSMVGYNNEKYLDFGWASARFDDLCNYIPARLTGIFMVFWLLVMEKPVKRAIHIMRRDACKHPSPNSGIPESIMAGGLGIRLGGLNFYGGTNSFRAYMGDPLNQLGRQHIWEAVKLMHGTAFTGVAIGSLLLWLAGK